MEQQGHSENKAWKDKERKSEWSSNLFNKIKFLISLERENSILFKEQAHEPAQSIAQWRSAQTQTKATIPVKLLFKVLNWKRVFQKYYNWNLRSKLQQLLGSEGYKPITPRQTQTNPTFLRRATYCTSWVGTEAVNLLNYLYYVLSRCSSLMFLKTCWFCMKQVVISWKTCHHPYRHICSEHGSHSVTMDVGTISLELNYPVSPQLNILVFQP